MPGLVPGIHVIPRMPTNVDGRDKPGPDDLETRERKAPIFKCSSVAWGGGGVSLDVAPKRLWRPLQTHSKFSMAHVTFYAVSE